jgi:hypothetical protein
MQEGRRSTSSRAASALALFFCLMLACASGSRRRAAGAGCGGSDGVTGCPLLVRGGGGASRSRRGPMGMMGLKLGLGNRLGDFDFPDELVDVIETEPLEPAEAIASVEEPAPTPTHAIPAESSRRILRPDGGVLAVVTGAVLGALGMAVAQSMLGRFGSQHEVDAGQEEEQHAQLQLLEDKLLALEGERARMSAVVKSRRTELEQSREMLVAMQSEVEELKLDKQALEEALAAALQREPEKPVDGGAVEEGALLQAAVEDARRSVAAEYDEMAQALRNEVALLRQQVYEGEMERSSLEGRLGQPAEAAAASAELDAQTARALELERQLAALQGELVDLQAQLDRARTTAADEAAELRAVMQASLDAEKARLQRQMEDRIEGMKDLLRRKVAEARSVAASATQQQKRAAGEEQSKQM